MIERTKVRRQEDREMLESLHDLRQYVCPVHFQDKEEMEKHRELVCKKIEKKADVSQVKNILYIVSILVAITCAVVAGQAIWLKSDISEVKKDAVAAVKETDHKIEQGFTTLHRRITENNEVRVKADDDQLLKLNSISTALNVIEYRLTQLEAEKKNLKR